MTSKPVRRAVEHTIAEDKRRPEQEEREMRLFWEAKQAAAAAILDLQKDVKPDPEGWTIRDYINYGRR